VKLLLALTSLAAMIGAAVPAHADPTDDDFLNTVKAVGITFPSPDRVIAAGRWVCSMANSGSQMTDVVKALQTENPGLTADHAAQFTAIAASKYCPTALAANGGKISEGP
jgi:hypothetical protein